MSCLSSSTKSEIIGSKALLTSKAEKNRIDINYYNSISMNSLKIVSPNLTCDSDRSSNQSISKNYQHSLNSSKNKNSSQIKNNGMKETLDLHSESSGKVGLLAGTDMSMKTVQDMVEMNIDNLHEKGFDEKDEHIGSNCVCGGFKFLSMLKA